MLHLLQDPLEDVDTSVGHVDLGLLVVRRHKVIVTLTGGGRKEGGREGGERERERESEEKEYKFVWEYYYDMEYPCHPYL